MFFISGKYADVIGGIGNTDGIGNWKCSIILWTRYDIKGYCLCCRQLDCNRTLKLDSNMTMLNINIHNVCCSYPGQAGSVKHNRPPVGVGGTWLHVLAW